MCAHMYIYLGSYVEMIHISTAFACSLAIIVDIKLLPNFKNVLSQYTSLLCAINIKSK